MRYTYAVFFTQGGRDLWALGGRRCEAIGAAKIVRGCVGRVRAERGARYDAPTFRALMDPVVDYRPARAAGKAAGDGR